MIEEILDGAPAFSKCDLTIREMTMRTDPTNESSPVIKRNFKPLDDSSNVLDVLQGVLLIKEGVIGDNVATGPLEHRHWRGCLPGTALDKFNEHALRMKPPPICSWSKSDSSRSLPHAKCFASRLGASGST
jgi:hypothetical protein